MKTRLQQLEGRIPWWIYSVGRTGIAEEEKPRPWAALGGHEGPSLPVVGPRPLIRGEGGGCCRLCPLYPPGPGARQRRIGPFSALRVHSQPSDMLRAGVSGIQVLVGHARAPPPCTGQGQGVFAGRGPTGFDTGVCPAVPHHACHPVPMK